MKRRDFIKQAGLTSLAAGGVAAPAIVRAETKVKWKMVTTWPKNFPVLGTGANQLAKLITDMTNGRIKVKVYGSGELVPAFEVFDAVSRGTAQMGHGAAYYHKGKVDAAQFFTAIPFGLNAQEMNGWLYYGGGLELWRELYEPFGLVPFPAGNSGVQMGGWFNKEINSVDDLKGLKMRIPGLGGEVLRRAGGTPVTLPGSEIFTALQTGTIDASEWVGPYNDLAFGLQKAASYYYYPGWQEVGPTLELLVNRDAWLTLPDDLKAIVDTTAQAVNCDMLAQYVHGNTTALQNLKSDPSVEVRPFPPEVLNLLNEIADEVVAEMAAADPAIAKIYESFTAYRDIAADWQRISEQAILETRRQR